MSLRKVPVPMNNHLQMLSTRRRYWPAFRQDGMVMLTYPSLRKRRSEPHWCVSGLRPCSKICTRAAISPFWGRCAMSTADLEPTQARHGLLSGIRDLCAMDNDV